MRNISEFILHLGVWSRRKCCFKILLFLALVASLFGRVEQFVQFW